MIFLKLRFYSSRSLLSDITIYFNVPNISENVRIRIYVKVVFGTNSNCVLSTLKRKIHIKHGRYMFVYLLVVVGDSDFTI